MSKEYNQKRIFDILCDRFQQLCCIIKNAHIEAELTPKIIKSSYNNNNTRINSYPKVSVIITNFNYAQYLNEAIESALYQSYTNKEIIVIDDGSTDDSHVILDSYKDDVIVIKQENKGQAAAFNSGFEKCSGDIICFLDADDYWEKSKIEEVVKKFQEGYWGMVCHDLSVKANQPIPKETFLFSKRINLSQFQGIIFPEFLKRGYKIHFTPTSGISITKSVADLFFPLHENGWKLCADQQIAFCCACLTQLGYICKPLGTYRMHGENNYFTAISKKSINTQIIDLINIMLCFKKFIEIYNDKNIQLFSPLTNYRYSRSWKFMTSKINLDLLIGLWKENVTYYKHNNYIRYKKIAITKFILFDTIIFLSLLFRIPSNKLKLRSLFLNKYSKEYDELLTTLY